jgi:uncharacterized protein YdaU (DUF1376 family)
MLNPVKVLKVAKKKLSAEALEFFKEQGARGGKIGTKRRMENLTAEQRSEVAKKAAAARWKGKKKPAPKE